ncbi:hypothetical protein [Spirochaeta lutea]|uniref:Uncharacterized protein n=1 Tax=Spirochaeta lutea TaxID=1480694 RepID=A0A098R0V9_9SPIO|nr:hypothetical protein [Spirochaeta lutea]KGE73386.1 hypothetical protein DC28_03680 [Spirochaeta lutea]
MAAVFYVYLKDDLNPGEQGKALKGRIEYLQENFTPGWGYPVLSVEYRQENLKKTTFYHIPDNQGHLGWYSSEYWTFAGIDNPQY